MATVRITLKAVGYPKIAPNSTLVLQSLEDVGFNIVLKDMKYKYKEKIIDYFHDHNLHISFKSIKDPDIDITDSLAIIGMDEIRDCTVDDLWERVDHLCLTNQVYERNPIDSFIPSYEPDSYFLVLDYGLSSQLIDSKPISIKGAHTKGARIMNARPSINTIDVVEAATFKVVEHFNKGLGCFESATEDVFFSLSV